jgi:glycine oxidase
MAFSGAEVLVVGAGIVGRSIAYYLSRAGARPLVIDAGDGPSNASRASLGVITHFSGGASTYALFIRDSHAVHRPLAAELCDETGIDVGWRPLGGIDLVLNDEDEVEAEANWQDQSQRGVNVERLNAEQVRGLEPNISAALRWGLYYAEDERVVPVQLGEALLQAALMRGAQMHYGERLEKIERSHSGGVEIQTSLQRRHADFLVLASGAWTAPLVEQLGAKIVLRPVRGQHGRFAGTAPRHVLRHGGHLIIPEAQSTLVGATTEDVGFENETTAEAARYLSAVRARVLAGAAGLIGQGAGLRAKPKAGRPMIGPLEGHPRVFVATGHYKNGVLMGPLTGQIVTRWMLEGDPARDMQPFFPER